MNPEILWGERALATLVALCFLSAIVLRHQKNLRQTVLMVLELEIIFLCGLVGWWLYNSNPVEYNHQFLRLKRTLVSDTPSAVKSAADAYLKTQIGPGFLADNLVYDQTLSGPSATGGWYQVIYHFKPLQKYGGSDQIKIPVINDQVAANFSASDNEVPDCLNKPDYCNFNLTSAEYASLQKQYNLDPGQVILKPPYLHLTNCRDSKFYLLDYRSKEVISDPDSSVCAITSQ